MTKKKRALIPLKKICKRCERKYLTYIPKNQYCPDCYKGNHFQEHFGELNSRRSVKK